MRKWTRVLCLLLLPCCGFAGVLDLAKDTICKSINLCADAPESLQRDISSIDEANRVFFFPSLRDLVQTKFFRYFKVNLWRPCPFWEDTEGLCTSQACSLEESNLEEVPRCLLTSTTTKPGELQRSNEDKCLSSDAHSEVNHGSGPVHNWAWDDNAWIVQDSTEQDTSYINLRLNPERFTGYAGASSRKAWQAMYQENAFLRQECQGVAPPVEQQCTEERVFYRIMSGLQSSINTHIALGYPNERGEWGSNLPLYLQRVGTHRGRLHNLVFTYAVAMKALLRAAPYLTTYRLNTGDPEEDSATQAMLLRLFSNTTAAQAITGSARFGFNETALFHDHSPTGPQHAVREQQKQLLKTQFREKFRNISRIMDCLGCEKCRLWGKLQIMGLGTALKILLADAPSRAPHNIDVSSSSSISSISSGGSSSSGGGDDTGLEARQPLPPWAPLQPNEVIALVNVAHNLGHSLAAHAEFRNAEFAAICYRCALFAVGGGVVLLGLAFAGLALAQQWGVWRL